MKHTDENMKLKDIKQDAKHEIQTLPNKTSNMELKCTDTYESNKYEDEDRDDDDDDDDDEDDDGNKNEKNEDENKYEAENGDEDRKIENKIDNEDENEVIIEYCSDATYIARQMISAERPSQEDMRKLYKLYVHLRHKVPPQHKIETRAGSHIPTPTEIQKFEEIVPCKKGVYSCDEDDIIVHNWRAFCKIHHWKIRKTAPFLQLRIGTTAQIYSTKERRKFVQFLADGLPNRTLYSVYHRFKTLYTDNINTRYTKEEDEMIIDHLENNPSLDEKCKYSDLAKVLRRTRHSIWRRYRILQKKKKEIMEDT